ncbi:MAG: hypothetical protein WCO57_06375 [Verrucomicrobiota bacterium]
MHVPTLISRKRKGKEQGTVRHLPAPPTAARKAQCIDSIHISKMLFGNNSAHPADQDFWALPARG